MENAMKIYIGYKGIISVEDGFPLKVIVPNPYMEDPNYILAAPHFIKALTYAEESYRTPSGRISLRWERITDRSIKGMELIEIMINLSDGIKGIICLPKGWEFEDGFCEKSLAEGRYRC